MKKFISLLVILVLVFFGLIVIGTIGANINLEEITLQVLHFKYVFLGIIKVIPLFFIFSYIAILVKSFK